MAEGGGRAVALWGIWGEAREGQLQAEWTGVARLSSPRRGGGGGLQLACWMVSLVQLILCEPLEMYPRMRWRSPESRVL